MDDSKVINIRKVPPGIIEKYGVRVGMKGPFSGKPVVSGGKHMPSKSKKQARTMAAAAHNPEFAKKVGIPVDVAEEFNKADEKTGIMKKKGPKK